MKNTIITPIGKDLIEDSALLLAKTFRDNQGNRIILKGLTSEEREKNQLSLFKGLIKACQASGTAEALIYNNCLKGVSLAYPPEKWPSSFLSWLYSAAGVIKTGPRFAARFARFDNYMKGNHINTPHWYISIIGIEPSCQGKALGSMLINPDTTVTLRHR